MKSLGWVLGGLILAGIGGLAIAEQRSPGFRPVAQFSTSLSGRTPNQRHNARLSLSEIHGSVLQPGETFSFNQRCQGWTARDGYRKAPVSYNGQLVDAWGGGVCQTSSTLFNAALLAGMEIVERHGHVFSPDYVPAGRDAAVAYETVDLKFRNPYPFPVRIEGRARGSQLTVTLTGLGQPKALPRVISEVDEVREPQTFLYGQGEHSRVRNSGKTGYSVTVWRLWPDRRREVVVRQTTPAMHRVVEYRP